MAMQYAYNYALIDETGWCYEVTSVSHEQNEEGWIAIPEYDDSYMDKYYNVADGKWYEDAEFTTEWSPA
jgi:hypothetical protein